MTSLTHYFTNATINVENPVEFANEMAIMKLIRSAESRFEALNEALNTTSDDKFYGQKGFRLVEMIVSSQTVTMQGYTLAKSFSR